MKFKKSVFLERIGLASGNRDPGGQDILLTGAATDPKTGTIVSLTSTTRLPTAKEPGEVNIKYWRHLPFGSSLEQNLITISTKPCRNKNEVEIDKIWVQTHLAYDSSASNQDGKKRNRALEGVNRLNTHLRAKGPVEETAKILAESEFDKSFSEHMVINGLDKQGNFDFGFTTSLFNRNAGRGKKLTLSNLDRNMLLTVLGFRINTMEPDKDFSGSREVVTTDPQSGITYRDRIKKTEYRNGRIVLNISVNPEDVPDDEIEAKAVPDLLHFDFRPNKDGSYTLADVKFLGVTIPPEDPEYAKIALKLLGIVQKANRYPADWKYPPFMDVIAEYDLLDLMDPLPPPPPLEEGGEFLEGSLHGTRFEKRIENFGDQIGIGTIFLHRGTRKDGSISTVGVAIDFPFATGGPDSDYDGAIPDYLPFWDDLKAFFITHDHFDHSDGMAYYAKAGMMREKDVYATAQVAYMLEQKMDFLGVDRRDRPNIHIVEDETPVTIYDEDGMARIRVQGSPNATLHSALCTPYIVSAWYGDDHFCGSSMIYGDGRGLTPEGEKFSEKGTRPLADLPGIKPELVDRDITVTYHDGTGLRYEGHSPTPEQVEDNLLELLSWFDDMGILFVPISTNNGEYVIGLNLAHKTGRNVTGVGRNAELRLTNLNLHGVIPNYDLSGVTIDPLEAMESGLIPEDVLDAYFAADSYDPDHPEKGRRKAFQEFREALGTDRLDLEKSVKLYMLDSLLKFDAVVFNNDINGYLMHLAIMDRNESASIRATRGSDLGKSFRDYPEQLFMFITGTQGNFEEKQSTFQKTIDFRSLLTANEQVRSTGYKIDLSRYTAIDPQPAIPGNEEAQESMIRAGVRNLDMTITNGFMNGFRVYNPRHRTEKILRRMKLKGWGNGDDDILDTEGNIRGYNVPIHLHGHGFREDIRKIAKSIPSEFHELHHIPGPDSYNIFRDLMRETGLHHSGIEPDDFQFMRIDANAERKEDRYKKVATINPSYVLVRMIRQYGDFFGGTPQLKRSTMLRREGHHRADGLMATVDENKTYERVAVQDDWEEAGNPENRQPRYRIKRMGPSAVKRSEVWPKNSSRPIFSGPLPPELEAK